ncbi:MAG: ribosome recycling factor [Microgenomates group bacterium]
MEKVLQMLRDDLLTLRAGRANPAMVEKIQVEAYGTKMPLVELATISAPDPNQLVVTPFDLTILKNIVEAIVAHKDLGLYPAVDGNIIRLKIPPLTEERRREFVKLLGQKLEAARIMIRQARGEKLREIRAKAQAKEITEDEEFRSTQELQKITDEFNQKIQEIGRVKEEELMGVR